MDRNRLYKVLIDGDEAGTAWPGQRLSFDVPSGEHRVAVKVDFMRSNELAVGAQAGEVVELACCGRGSAIALFNTIFRRNAYLDLHVMTAPERAASVSARPGTHKPRNLGEHAD